MGVMCPGSWDEWTCSEAARHGHVEFLQYALANECPRDELQMCRGAAFGGNLEVLRWLREEWEGRDDDWQTPACPWSSITCQQAAKGGHLNVFLWGLEYGCPITDDSDDGDDRSYNNICRNIGKGSNIEILKLVLESRVARLPPDSADWIGEAAFYGQVHMLQWGLDNGFDVFGSWGRDHRYSTCKMAAIGNKIEVLKWALQSSYNWMRRGDGAGVAGSVDSGWSEEEWDEHGADEMVFAYAASGKNTLDMMKWLFDAGCPWDVRTLDRAASIGRLGNLKFSFANGCPRTFIAFSEDYDWAYINRDHYSSTDDGEHAVVLYNEV
jgi:hypothetical protein